MTATGMKVLAKAVRSTGWKTVSANGKQLISEMLASGNIENASRIAGRLAGLGAAELAIPRD